MKVAEPIFVYLFVILASIGIAIAFVGIATAVVSVVHSLYV